MTTTPIVALDVPTAKAALDLVADLGEDCRFYKIGAELFTACGPSVVRDVQGRGAAVFLDLKYHDIPNTVAGGVRGAAALGARLVTVHAAGGPAMLRAAVDAAGDQSRCGVLAVTILTSLGAAEVASLCDHRARQVTDAHPPDWSGSGDSACRFIRRFALSQQQCRC